MFNQLESANFCIFSTDYKHFAQLGNVWLFGLIATLLSAFNLLICHFFTLKGIPTFQKFPRQQKVRTRTGTGTLVTFVPCTI